MCSSATSIQQRDEVDSAGHDRRQWGRVVSVWFEATARHRHSPSRHRLACVPMISAVASTAKLSCRQGSAKTDPSGAMKPRSSNIDGSSTKAWLSAGGTGRGCGSAAVGQWGSRAVGNVPEQIPHVDYSKSISRSTTFETPTTPREPSYEDTSIFRQYGPPEKLNPRLHAHGSTYVVSTPTEDKMLASRQPRRILTCRGERKEVQNLHLRVLQSELASSKICCHSERVEKLCIFSEYALQEHDRTEDGRRAEVRVKASNDDL